MTVRRDLEAIEEELEELIGMGVYALALQLGELMAAIDDLNTAVANLQAEVAPVLAAIQAGTANDTAIAAAVTGINSVVDQLKAALPAPPA